MKCTICGETLAPNDQFCKNCGTKVSEMSKGSFGSGASQYGGQSTLNYTMPVNTKTSRGSSYGSVMAVRVVVALVVLLIGFGIFMFKQNFTHRVDCGDFTIKLPYSCSKDTSMSGLTAGLAYGENSGGYSNSDLAFAYIAYDMSDVDQSTMNGESLTSFFVTYMDIALESEETGYQKISIDDNSLKFYFRNDTYEKAYSTISCHVHGDKLYMLVFMCESKDKDKYDPKFTKYTDTLTFK